MFCCLLCCVRPCYFILTLLWGHCNYYYGLLVLLWIVNRSSSLNYILFWSSHTVVRVNLSSCSVAKSFLLKWNSVKVATLLWISVSAYFCDRSVSDVTLVHFSHILAIFNAFFVVVCCVYIVNLHWNVKLNHIARPLIG